MQRNKKEAKNKRQLRKYLAPPHQQAPNTIGRKRENNKKKKYTRTTILNAMKQ